MSSPGTQQNLRQRGFTLLEMLVVVTVLGLLMVGLVRGVRTGLLLWETQSRRVGETAELDAAARTLRSLLSGIAASPSSGLTGTAGTSAGPKGDVARFAFIGDLPTGLGTTQRADITLELSHGRLVLRWTPRRHELSAVPTAQPTETELVRNVERLELAYWGPTPSGEGATWQTQWDGPAIPELIRVRLGFATDDRRRFPDLIAAPQS